LTLSAINGCTEHKQSASLSSLEKSDDSDDEETGCSSRRNIVREQLEQEEALALVRTIKERFENSADATVTSQQEDRASLMGWLLSRLGPKVIQDDKEEARLVPDEILIPAVVSYIHQERYRRAKSLAFRKKRMET
jgi:hypothetical protein